MLRRSIWLVACLLAAELVACGTSGGGNGPGDDVEGEPLVVSWTLDAPSTSVTQIVTPDGGTLTTTGTDGTVYTLEIPPDGLVMAAEITMTPMTSLEGFPLSDGLLGAVHLEPEGLFFATPALLTIEPARNVPVDQHITFATRANGEAFLYPVEPDPSVISMQITHFSGYGAGSGTDGDRDSAASNTPSQAADRIIQNMAQASDYLRRGIITQEEWNEFFMQASRQYYQQVIKPKMDHAEAIAPNGNPADLDTLSDAVSEYLSWERQLQLLGMEDFMQVEREALLAQLIRISQKFYEAIYDRCTEQHDLSVIQLLISLERQMQLLGIEYEGTFTDCLQFEIEFDSVMVNDQNWFGDTVEEFHVRATIPVFLTGTGFSGTGPLEYVGYAASGWIPDFPEGQCPITPAGTAGSTFEVLSLDILYAEPNQTPSIVLSMNPGTPTEYLTLTCSSGTTTSESNEWVRFWRVNHSWESVSPEWWDEPVRTIVDWDYVGGQVLAEKAYNGDGTLPNGNLTAVETTTLTIKHTPVDATP